NLRLMRHRSPTLIFPPRSFSWCALSSLGRAWSSCHGSFSSQVSCSCFSFLLLHHRLNHGDACSCCPCFFCPAWGNLDGCDLFLHNCKDRWTKRGGELGLFQFLK